MAIGDGWANGAWQDAGWTAGAWFDSGIPFANINSLSLSEEQIVNGGQQIVITVSNDTWVTAGATFNAQRQNIIDGLTSAQSEATGWNAEVRDKEVVTAVVRTSDTVVTITLSAAAAFDITSGETVTVTIPASALSAAGSLVGAPSISISIDSGDMVSNDTTIGHNSVTLRHNDTTLDHLDPAALRHKRV